MGVGIYLQAYGVPFVFYNSDLFIMTNIGEVFLETALVCGGP